MHTSFIITLPLMRRGVTSLLTHHKTHCLVATSEQGGQLKYDPRVALKGQGGPQKAQLYLRRYTRAEEWMFFMFLLPVHRLKETVDPKVTSHRPAS